MKYNITKNTPPAMSNLVRVTEIITFLPSQASRDMQQSIVPMLFSPLGAHISGAEFQNPDLSWQETSGMLSDIKSKNTSWQATNIGGTASEPYHSATLPNIVSMQISGSTPKAHRQ